MSYLDPEGRSFQPTGLIVSGLLNGAAIFVILTAAYTVTPKGPDFIPRLDWIEPDAPPVEPATAKPPEKQEAQTVTRAPVVNHGPVSETPPLTGVTPDTGTRIVAPPVEPDPPAARAEPVPMPVIRIARPDPRFASALQPRYPESMIRAEKEGSVSVRVLVGTDGRVHQIEILNSDDEAFSQVTREQALKRWRFLAATRDGAPIESWREMNLKFRLPD